MQTVSWRTGKTLLVYRALTERAHWCKACPSIFGRVLTAAPHLQRKFPEANARGRPPRRRPRPPPSRRRRRADAEAASGGNLGTTMMLVLGGYRLGWGSARFGGFVGVEGGAGALLQADFEDDRWSVALLASPLARATWWPSSRLALSLEARVAFAWFDQDHPSTRWVLPSVGLALY